MFWGSFFYNKKNLYYIQEEKTITEKKYAKAKLVKLNTTKKDFDRAN